MKQLQVRILLQHVKGDTIAYFYNRESFDLLNIELLSYNEFQFIEIGNIIQYEDKKYVVKTINFKMEKKLYAMENKDEYNIYSPSDQSDFNCEIGVFVDNP